MRERRLFSGRSLGTDIARRPSVPGGPRARDGKSGAAFRSRNMARRFSDDEGRRRGGVDSCPDSSSRKESTGKPPLVFPAFLGEPLSAEKHPPDYGRNAAPPLVTPPALSEVKGPPNRHMAAVKGLTALPTLRADQPFCV